MLNISIEILPNGKDLPLPKYQTPLSAGLDLIAALSSDLALENMQYRLIPTGIAIAIPTGYEAQIRPRSGLAIKHGVTVLNSPGTIDADYRGEIKVCLINFSEETFIITRGMRIAQLIINKIEICDWAIVAELEETVRGKGGFGSTGI